MSPTTEHPSPDVLAHYLNGRTDEARSAAIEAHLETCHICQETTKRVRLDDRFVELVKRSVPPSTDSKDQVTVAARSTDGHKSSPAIEQDLAAVDEYAINGYAIVGELGRGGMGVVYEAIHQKLRRRVALKAMLSGVHADSMERQRFFLEAETIAKLQHPGIVQVFEVGEQGGNLFIALELVSGGTLSDWMKEDRPDEVASAVMMYQLARSLEFAHGLGVIHRDLKPGNVLIQPEVDRSGSSISSWPAKWIRLEDSSPKVPTAKITDFGLAKDAHSDLRLTQTGIAVGTPAYMSPEQAVGRETLPRPTTDIYSLGA
ncbi:MAG: protein kinase, partial [Verrucomicrobiota bacterium]